MSGISQKLVLLTDRSLPMSPQHQMIDDDPVRSFVAALRSVKSEQLFLHSRRDVDNNLDKTKRGLLDRLNSSSFSFKP
jgi:hypothetical protein